MSSDLTWLLTRNSNSFLVKRNGVVLSREPGNLRNLHSFKYSGFAPTKTVDVSAGAKGVVVTLSKTKNASKVSASKTVVPLTGSTRASAKSVKALLSNYRPDLTAAALARVSRINESQKPPKPVRAKAARRNRAKKL
ncbi:hypothetical protein HK105_202962 [Polyrhizophydium stewartii]|uniref:Ribosomal eL28/Mak16 domain-containing protein n=1 Tax=Polyrhizophydium stewartii TaxID=2732419 RepID=A0ABR4NCQ7_9FUNG|nr:hypothetical protein HK105_000702 [Polyrhizophydium stewartii]